MPEYVLPHRTTWLGITAVGAVFPCMRVDSMLRKVHLSRPLATNLTEGMAPVHMIFQSLIHIYVVTEIAVFPPVGQAEMGRHRSCRVTLRTLWARPKLVDVLDMPRHCGPFIDSGTMGALFPVVSLHKVLVHPYFIEAQRAEVARLFGMTIAKVAFRARGRRVWARFAFLPHVLLLEVAMQVFFIQSIVTERTPMPVVRKDVLKELRLVVWGRWTAPTIPQAMA